MTTSTDLSQPSTPAHAPPMGHPGATPGAVAVSVEVAGAPGFVWAALTDRDIVAKWFGDLSASLEPGCGCRLDFGDGDFFDIEDVTLDPPERLSYRWRFLGTSPINRIEWDIEPATHGCRVLVTDTKASRSEPEIAEMIEGWSDFLARLQSFCATGGSSRYAWRSSFEGAIELSVPVDAATDRLLSPHGLRRWLPWAGGVEDQATIEMLDGQEPKRLEIGDVAYDGSTILGSTSLTFELSTSEWRGPTRCRIEVKHYLSGAVLFVSHDGWPDLCVADAERRRQRTRFGALWTQALQRARDATRDLVPAGDPWKPSSS